MTIVAIDQGTTSTRAIRITPDGRIAVAATRRHAQHHPGPVEVEHDAEELLAHVRGCLAAAGPAAAIGLSNQGETCLAWDAETGRPIGPAIVWQDARTGPRLDGLKREGAEAETLARAGLPLDPYFSASKLAWLVERMPEARALLARGRLRLGTTDAFFLDRLTGHFATDVTTASRTSLMNLATGAWDPELCRLFGVPIEALPEIRSTVGDFGAIVQGPVTASVVDQQAALYGHGARRRGDGKVTFGTGAFVLAVTGDAGPLTERPGGLLPTAAWRIGATTTYAVDGGVWSAGAAVEWLLRLGLATGPEALVRFDGPPAISRGLAFVPALVGLGVPHWDRAARGLWIGMGLGTTPADLARSVLEGVALRTAEVVATIAAAVPMSGPLSVDGGLTASPYFCRFLASALGRSVRVAAERELTAVGAAQLAALGVGIAWPDGAMVGGQVIEPAEDNAAWRRTFAEAVRRAEGWTAAAGLADG